LTWRLVLGRSVGGRGRPQQITLEETDVEKEKEKEGEQGEGAWAMLLLLLSRRRRVMRRRVARRIHCMHPPHRLWIWPVVITMMSCS
jgi:hypothetical protein